MNVCVFAIVPTFCGIQHRFFFPVYFLLSVKDDLFCIGDCIYCQRDDFAIWQGHSEFVVACSETSSNKTSSLCQPLCIHSRSIHKKNYGAASFCDDMVHINDHQISRAALLGDQFEPAPHVPQGWLDEIQTNLHLLKNQQPNVNYKSQS